MGIRTTIVPIESELYHLCGFFTLNTALALRRSCQCGKQQRAEVIWPMEGMTALNDGSKRRSNLMHASSMEHRW